MDFLAFQTMQNTPMKIPAIKAKMTKVITMNSMAEFFKRLRKGKKITMKNRQPSIIGQTNPEEYQDNNLKQAKQEIKDKQNSLKIRIFILQL